MKLLLGFGAALSATGAVCSPTVAASRTRHSAPTSANSQLKVLYNGYAFWDAKESGYFENSGEIESAGYLAHVDATSQLRRATHLKELLEQLDAIPKGKLSPDEQVNAAIFRTLLENSLSEARFRTWEMPFNSDSSFWTYLDASQPFDDASGYRRYIARMREIPRYFAEQIVNMRAGLARGFSVPRPTLEGRDKSIATFIVDQPEKSSFYKPFERFPPNVPARDQEALRSEGQERDPAIGDARLSEPTCLHPG